MLMYGGVDAERGGAGGLTEFSEGAGTVSDKRCGFGPLVKSCRQRTGVLALNGSLRQRHLHRR